MMKLDGKGFMTVERYQATEHQGQSPLPEGDRRAEDMGLVKDTGFLTIEDVARYLGIKEKTLYARASETPLQNRATHAF